MLTKGILTSTSREVIAQSPISLQWGPCEKTVVLCWTRRRHCRTQRPFVRKHAAQGASWDLSSPRTKAGRHLPKHSELTDLREAD